MHDLSKKTGLYLLCSIFIALTSACGSSSHRLPASLIKSITEYIDGVAVAEANDDCFYFVDQDLSLIQPGFKLIRLDSFMDGYAYAESERIKGDVQIREKHIYNRKGEPIVSVEYDKTLILSPGGKIWRPSANGMQYVNLSDTTILFDEKLWGLSVTPSGTSLLIHKRSDKAADDNGNVPLLEYMLLSPDGDILVPWGRISYISDFCNGMAIASNSVRPGYRWHVDEITQYIVHGHNYATYGFINERGAWVVPEKYYWAENYNDTGYGRVSSTVPHYGDRPVWKYVDRNGRVLGGSEAEKARQSFIN